MSDALVIAVHGRRLQLRAPDGREWPARLGSRDLSAVCGDQINTIYDARHNEWNVVQVEPRRNVLGRSNSRGGGEPIAANLTRLVVVIAPLPKTDFFLADRYLCAAQCSAIPSVIVLNKRELPMPAESDSELDAFVQSGIPVLRVSAHSGDGLDTLRAALVNQTSIVVGQSGVGKTSLLRSLVPDCDARVGELMRDDEGRHTTTVTRMYSLPGGGDLLDAPGVRDFAPDMQHLDPASLGFVEVQSLAGACRFADCRHLHEPDCAVQLAVSEARMSARRYESYRRLRRLFERLTSRD
jgi:ribosome biogenesis GTPase / thiamine phosphate phosphatase